MPGIHSGLYIGSGPLAEDLAEMLNWFWTFASSSSFR